MEDGMTHRNFAMKALLLAVGIAAVALTVFSQNGAAPAAGPAFEVVSIKPGAPVLTRIAIQMLGNRFIAEGFNLKMLVARAYNVTENRIIGGPNWADSDRFNVEATAEGPAIRPDQLAPMLQ